MMISDRQSKKLQRYMGAANHSFIVYCYMQFGRSKRCFFWQYREHYVWQGQPTLPQISANTARTGCVSFQRLPHMPYSPALALLDFALFPYFKSQLWGHRAVWKAASLKACAISGSLITVNATFTESILRKNKLFVRDVMMLNFRKGSLFISHTDIHITHL